jgi:sialate O-acetylesterase
MKYADMEDELRLHQAALKTYQKSDFEQKNSAWFKSLEVLSALEKDQPGQVALSSLERDDHDWVELNTPQNWDTQGFKDVYGEAWYRKTLEIPSAWAGRQLELGIGQVDEIDTAFFNGVKIGGCGSVSPYDASSAKKPRLYNIAPDLVKKGRAVIAVRVVNLTAQGGLCGPADAMFLRLTDDTKESLPLTGKWHFRFNFRRPDKPCNPESPNSLACLYKALIHPVIPFAIKGVIWYQGENNTHNAYAYRERFAGMISDWRSRWGQGDFPFLWVQLANFQTPKTKPEEDTWAVLRESQDAVLTLPNTGTALAIDVGDANDIHPKDKQTVGARLALTARAVAYGEQALIYSGPRYQSVNFHNGKAYLSFTHAGGGLRAKGGSTLQRFSIAGEDKKWIWANAVIKGDQVIVSSEQVTSPAAVRYAFEANPDGANLYNAEGLPAAPFRTDNWRVGGQPKTR